MNPDPEIVAEEKRLGQTLAPFLESGEERELAESTEPAVAEEIERLVGLDDLSIAGRMQTQSDIRAVLDHRLEPSDFITALAERRVATRHAESISARAGERLTLEA